MNTVIHGDFEWDRLKNRKNIKKHFLSFEAAIEIFKGIILEIPADGNFGEERVVAIGELESKEVLVVYRTHTQKKDSIGKKGKEA